MASLLSSHLEQISLCATSIAELSFPGPRMFTNALISTHDITALIRDTEQHERALFHLAPPPLPCTSSMSDFTASVSGTAPSTGARRATAYGSSRQAKNKAVAAVLGGDLYQRTRRADAAGRQKGDIDVEVLLQGAEKLAAVYPIAGATEQITQLRRRYQQLAINIEHYQSKVDQQDRALRKMSRPSVKSGFANDDDEEEDSGASGLMEDAGRTTTMSSTKEDLECEMEEIRDLERKKRGLEDRVTGMEKDLGGLLR